MTEIEGIKLISDDLRKLKEDVKCEFQNNKDTAI